MKCGADNTTCMARSGDQCLEHLFTDTPTCSCRVPQTNADYIRSMSDEELAEFLSNVYFGGFNDGLHRPPRVEKTLYTTDWLRQPKEDKSK